MLYLITEIKHAGNLYRVQCTGQFVSRGFCAWSKYEVFDGIDLVLNFIKDCQVEIEEQNKETEENE